MLHDLSAVIVAAAAVSRHFTDPKKSPVSLCSSFPVLVKFSKEVSNQTQICETFKGIQRTQDLVIQNILTIEATWQMLMC